MNNDYSSLENEKRFFTYLVNNKLFNYDDVIFEVQDFKRIYKCIKDYYSEYQSIPPSDIIEKQTEIKLKLINQILSYDISNVRKYSYPPPNHLLNLFCEDFINRKIIVTKCLVNTMEA